MAVAVGAACVACGCGMWSILRATGRETGAHSMPPTTVELQSSLLLLLLPFFVHNWRFGRVRYIWGDLLLEIFCMLLIEMQARPEKNPFG